MSHTHREWENHPIRWNNGFVRKKTALPQFLNETTVLLIQLKSSQHIQCEIVKFACECESPWLQKDASLLNKRLSDKKRTFSDFNVVFFRGYFFEFCVSFTEQHQHFLSFRVVLLMEFIQNKHSNKKKSNSKKEYDYQYTCLFTLWQRHSIKTSFQ